MKCIQLLLASFCLHCVAAVSVDDRLLQIYQNVREDGVISQTCQDALELYAENILSLSDPWAFQMFDATSKIPNGLLSYNFGELGQFSQCLDSESMDGSIKAKYCLATLSLSSGATNAESEALSKTVHNMRQASRQIVGLKDTDEPSEMVFGIKWALCLPSNCSDGDVREIFGQVSDTITVSCQTKEDLSPPLTNGAIATIVVLAIFALLLVVSTALDLYCHSRHTKPAHAILTAFSVYSNGNKLFRISKNSTELTCLNGIRFFSMMWVIIAHVFSLVIMESVINMKDLMKWTQALRSMTIASGSMAVDSFFLIGGAVLVYSYFKSKHHGTKFNIFQFYIHRYLRLTPALAAMILVAATLTQYMGSGPNWPIAVTTLAAPCQEYWWSTLLYAQNYVNQNSKMCLPQTWYLSVDMQLYIISPLILIPLWKYSKIGIGIIITGVVTFIIVPFCIAYYRELPALMTDTKPHKPSADYMQYYYLKTHGRAAPWFIGLLLGYILAKIKFQGEKKDLTFNKVIITLVWAVCLAVILTCIYGGHSTLMGPDYDKWGTSFYIGFVRPVWGLCLAWVIFACVSGYGGPINWFLSWPVYQVLNRFTYSIYLIHYPLLIILTYNHKTGFYFSELNQAYSFWGITMFSFAASVPWVLAFESPIVVIEKLIFGGPRTLNKEIINEEKGHKNDITPTPGENIN